MGKKKNNKKKQDAPQATFAYDNEAPAAQAGESPAELKERGNALVKAGNHADAIALFSLAIERGPPAEELHLYHSNRAVCALALKRYEEAVRDGERCVATRSMPS